MENKYLGESELSQQAKEKIFLLSMNFFLGYFTDNNPTPDKYKLTGLDQAINVFFALAKDDSETRNKINIYISP